MKDIFDLSAHATLPDFTFSSGDITSVIDGAAKIAPPQNNAPVDISFTQQVIGFAKQSKGRPGPAQALNNNAVCWHDDGTFTTNSGEPAPLCITDKGTVLIDATRGFDRAQGTLTELIEHGAKPPLYLDMMDARFLGTPNRKAAPRRTVAYNRRIGAKNLTLWPLTGYHNLAPTGQLGGYPIDDIPFENKADRCVWLGNITGRMSPHLTPQGRDLRGVYDIRKQALELARTAAEWPDIIAELNCVPRYNIVKSLRNHSDFVVGLVLRDKWKLLATSPAFVGLAAAVRPRTWFHKFRYILSLAGNDTGSNFLSAAASNSLILKEEDGWELFYTDAFKPWVHYVPLVDGATDVEEKLAWARAHPSECADMVRASTQIYDRFANANNRAAILRGIAEHLNASR